MGDPSTVISDTYLNVQEARASAALPAAGAWDATPTEMLCPGFGRVILTFVYTRGGAGGGFDFQIELSLFSLAALVPAGGSEWEDQTAFAAQPLVLGTDVRVDFEQAYGHYLAAGATAESFILTFDLDEGFERIRIPAREWGNVGAPGTLQVSAKFVQAE